MDTKEPSSKAQKADEDVSGEVSRLLELLRADREFRESGTVLLADLPGALQVAKPAEPETELHVASVQSVAETIRSASTTDCGEQTETTGDSLLLGLEARTVTGPVSGPATDLTARA